MINRELIRLKVVQLVYADYKNEGKPVDAAMKELAFSVAKAFELYHYLLLLITNVTDYGVKRYEMLCSRIESIGGKETPSPRFIKNRFALQLESNRTLSNFADSPKNHRWTEAEDVIRSIYKDITESDLYRKYMDNAEDSYAVDRDFWRKAYKSFICNNEKIEAVLEEWSIYWNDDKDIVDTFVLKTIKRFDEHNGAEQPLLAAYEGEEDRQFAGKLFESVLLHHQEYEEMIRQSTRNWDFNRLAIMDVVIMVTALAEVINIPSIDISVTFNEYINIAKVYSSPKSAGYINGMLDHIVQQLKQENKLFK